MLEQKIRIPSIDRFRGLALMLMLMFGSAKMMTVSPLFLSLSTHNLEDAFLLLNGYGFYDVIAPLFVFASGLSFSGGQNKGKKALKIIGIGSLLLFSPSSLIGLFFFIIGVLVLCALVVWYLLWKKEGSIPFFSLLFDNLLTWLGGLHLIVSFVQNILYVVGVEVSGELWGPLSSIGLAMLLALPFAKLNASEKGVWCYVLTAFYLLLNITLPQSYFVYFTHGGMAGGIGYFLLYLYAHTLVAFHKENKGAQERFFALSLAVLASVAYLYIVPSKSAVNFSYILISFTFSATIFYLISLFDNKITKVPLLTSAGKNSLLLYLLHFACSFVAGICLNALIMYLSLPMLLTNLLCLVSIFGYFSGMSYLVYRLNKKGFRFKI